MGNRTMDSGGVDLGRLFTNIVEFIAVDCDDFNVLRRIIDRIRDAGHAELDERSFYDVLAFLMQLVRAAEHRK